MRVLTASLTGLSKTVTAPASFANVTAKVANGERFREAFAAEAKPAHSTVTHSDTPAAKPREVAGKPREEQHAVHEDGHTQGGKDASGAKKSSHKDDAGAGDVTLAPVAAVEEPVPLLTVPVVPVPTVAADVVPGPANAQVTAEAPPAAKMLQAGKSVGSGAREAKKVEGVVVAAAPVAKAEVVVATAVVVQAGSLKIAEVSTGAAVGAVAGMHGSATAKAVAPPASLAKAVQEPAQNSDIKTLIATPNVLEVGIASGSHGWLRVRAELGQMGEVMASVAAASAGAAEGLHKELPAISAYLAGERVGVSSLVVNAADKGAGAQDAAMSAGAGTQPGSDRRQSGTPRAQSTGASVEIGVDFGLAAGDLPAAVFANGSGSWLSVRV